MSKVIDLIKQDHRNVEQLFQQFETRHDHSIARKICAELTAHAIIEEELIYPILRNNVDKDDAEHAQEEHDEAKKLIARIEALESDEPELGDMVSKLKDSISHHVKEEETEVLPEMEQQASNELNAIESEFVQRKRQLAEAFV